MKIGLIGLGRMGGNIARRLMRGGHEVVAWDHGQAAIDALVRDGAEGATSIEDMHAKLPSPAIWWVMLPAGDPTEQTVAAIAALSSEGAVIIDGGNTFYKDDIRRAKELREKGIRYVDVGTSGGVWGLERGYCMMIGADNDAFDLIDPILKTLAPGLGTIARTPNRMEQEGEDHRAELGYIHAGPAGIGPLRQDDPQRHRVWLDAGLCRRLRHPEGEVVGQIAGGSALRSQLDRHCRGVAAGQRDLVVAARPHGGGAREGSDVVELFRPGRRFGRRPLDDRSGDGGGGAGQRPRDPRCSPAIAAGSSMSSPIRSCRRCASASAGTSRCRSDRAGVMNPIRLLVSDVDGTLVDKEKRLTAPTADAVRRLEAAGCAFTIISARPRSGMMPIADTLAIDAPMAAFNGGIIFHRDGRVDEHHVIDPAAARGVFDLLDGAAVDRWVFADDAWYASTDQGVHVEHERIASNQEPIVRGDFDDLLDHADKITFVSDDPALLKDLHERCRVAFGERATIVQSQTYYLDVTALEANKGSGIVSLTAAIGVDLAETAAIGDQNNDLPMLERAGFAVAMGNAPANVQDAADAVTSANDADGVAHAIDSLILPRLGAKP